MDSARLVFAGSHWLLRQTTTSNGEPSGNHPTKLKTSLPSVSTWPQEHAGQAEGLFPLPGKLFLPPKRTEQRLSSCAPLDKTEGLPAQKVMMV